MADNEEKQPNEISITAFASDLKKIMIDMESTNIRTSEGEVVYLQGVRNHVGVTDPLTGDIIHSFESFLMRNGFPMEWCPVRLVSQDTFTYTGTLTQKASL